MIRSTRHQITALTVGLLLGWTAHGGFSGVLAQRRTPFMVTRIFTGPDGQARSEQVEMKLTPGTTPSARSLDTSQPVTASQLTAVRISPGYFADWHPVNSRRYVVGVSGRREIEVADGKKITLGPGSVSLVEDLTGKGHLTRTVGTEDAITLIISLADSK
jgi:hypothetical protein